MVRHFPVYLYEGGAEHPRNPPLSDVAVCKYRDLCFLREIGHDQVAVDLFVSSVDALGIDARKDGKVAISVSRDVAVPACVSIGP